MNILRDDFFNRGNTPKRGKPGAGAEGAPPPTPRVVHGIVLPEPVRRMEEDESSWIYSFADLILNLLMFFVMLSAISSVDREKLEAIQQAMNNVKPDKVQRKQQRNNEEPVRETKRHSQSSPERLSNAEILEQVKKLLASLNRQELEKEKENQAIFAMLEAEIAEVSKRAGGQVAFDPDKDSFELVFATPRLFDDKNAITQAGRGTLVSIAAGLNRLSAPLFVLVQSFVSPPAQKEGNDEGKAYSVTSERAVNVVLELKNAGMKTQHTLAAAGLGGLGPLAGAKAGFNDRVVIRVARMVDKSPPKTFREKAQ